MQVSAPANPPAAIPLHKRTPEQLRDGLVVKVAGTTGGDDLAVARLIQDGTQYIAKVAGTSMGLGSVSVNDTQADKMQALGIANFVGTSGWFGLSTRSTGGLVDGIKRLRERPFETWTEAQRQDFIQANETILHEAGHVTLPSYSEQAIGEWRRASRPFEEGLTEVVTMSRIVPFMRDEFGIDIAPASDRISQSTSAYTRYSERIRRMLGMGTDGSSSAIAEAASQVADNVPASQRFAAIAQRMSTNLGGPNPPKAIVDEVARTLDPFVAEQAGTRTRLMQLQAALVDHRAGQPFDETEFRKKLAEHDARYPHIFDATERIGDGPIVDSAE
jgi:hypothetical protein